MSVAEAIFAADSRAAAELVRCLTVNGWTQDHTTLLVLTMDDLLDGLGLDAAARLQWYRSQTEAGAPDIGAEYRRRRSVLRSMLADHAQFLATQPSGARDRLDPVRSSRRRDATRRSSPRAGRWRRARPTARDAVFQASCICTSIASAPVRPLKSSQILGLLARTRESLAKAPVSSSDSTSRALTATGAPRTQSLEAPFGAVAVAKTVAKPLFVGIAFVDIIELPEPFSVAKGVGRTVVSDTRPGQRAHHLDVIAERAPRAHARDRVPAWGHALREHHRGGLFHDGRFDPHGSHAASDARPAVLTDAGTGLHEPAHEAR